MTLTIKTTIKLSNSTEDDHNHIEGVGIFPDIFTDNTMDSFEVIKQLSRDNELSLPEDYMKSLKKNTYSRYKK